jgi:hypothetical protein
MYSLDLILSYIVWCCFFLICFFIFFATLGFELWALSLLFYCLSNVHSPIIVFLEYYCIHPQF